MSATRKPEPASRAKQTPPALSASPDAAFRVPRAWLAAILAVLVVPWAVVAWVYLDGVAEPPAPVSSGPTARVDGGPWGELTATRIVISPPIEYVSPEGGRGHAPEWFFPGTSGDVLEAFLTSVGLSREEVTRARNSARPDARIGGLVVSPDVAWIRSISPDVRGRLYSELAKTPLNFDQEQAFRFLGSSPAQWLDGSAISAETRALVEPLIYRNGDFLYFADIEAIRPQIQETAEFQRLVKTLLRHSTTLLRLSVTSPAEVEGLADYWGRGGRRTDIRPLLESVAGAGADRSIDVVHLLPTFARNHLYRYPKLTAADFDRPIIANCLWTALNFFNGTPDDRYLEPQLAIDTLRKNYYVIEHGYQLGDVVAFLDDEGDLFHVAVYIADDILFSKNGTSPMAPWTFMSTDHVKSYYRERAESPRLIYHRRSDM